jgi:hypothetical protein
MFSEDALQSAGTWAQQIPEVTSPDVTSARAIAISFMGLLYTVGNSFGEREDRGRIPRSRACSMGALVQAFSEVCQSAAR